MIRAIIADDHPVVRQGIRRIIEAAGDMAVVGEAASGRQTIEFVLSTPCDIVVLDLTMPDLDGLDVLKRLKKERPDLPMLVLTMHSEEQFAVRALKAGASGYLTKEGAPAQLVDGIRRLVNGGRFISAGMAERLAARIDPDAAKPPHEQLSDREFEVLRLIASGQRSREIAVGLSLSVKTISTYRTRILEKMKMKSSAELIAYVLRHHLAD